MDDWIPPVLGLSAGLALTMAVLIAWRGGSLLTGQRSLPWRRR